MHTHVHDSLGHSRAQTHTDTHKHTQSRTHKHKHTWTAEISVSYLEVWGLGFKVLGFGFKCCVSSVHANDLYHLDTLVDRLPQAADDDNGRVLLGACDASDAFDTNERSESYVTRHMSHVTCHTSHVTRHLVLDRQHRHTRLLLHTLD